MNTSTRTRSPNGMCRHLGQAESQRAGNVAGIDAGTVAGVESDLKVAATISRRVKVARGDPRRDPASCRGQLPRAA